MSENEHAQSYQLFAWLMAIQLRNVGSQIANPKSKINRDRGRPRPLVYGNALGTIAVNEKGKKTRQPFSSPFSFTEMDRKMKRKR